MFSGDLIIFINYLLIYILFLKLLKMTLIITHYTLLYGSSISVMKASEFKNLFSFKVVDIWVFFNLKLVSAQFDLWIKSYAYNTTDAQNWNFQNCTSSKCPFKFPISKINISSPIITLNWPKFHPKWFHWDPILFYLQNKLKHIKMLIKLEKL